MKSKRDIYIFGISAFYHDSAACLIKNGEIMAAAQEERFTRKKHDPAFPSQAIHYCLKEAGINVNDLDFVGFYEKPFLKFERLLLNYLTFAPRGFQSFLKAMPVWLKEKIFLKDLISQELNYPGEILFVEHHDSHAASAFYPSPFEKLAILTIDGVGEWTTTSFGLGEGNIFNLTHEIKYPHSLGLLYSAFTYYLGFRVNSGEYKVMGLAPYGEPKYVNLIKEKLIDIKQDGSFRLNMEYFNYCSGLTMVSRKFCHLFNGPAREPESGLTQKHMDIARSIQEITEEIMVKLAKHVYQVTKHENLCLAGGVALNCVGNGKILKETKFRNIWIQPAAGDAGGALGAALFIWFRYLGQQRISNNSSDHQKGTFLGPQYSQEQIESFLQQKEVSYNLLSLQEISEKIAYLINQQKVIGIFQGRMEFGPRALGARSIVADPRNERMQSLLNLKIKFRESFRPFAPSILKEKLSEYFDLDVSAPYMLLVAPIKADKILVDPKNINFQGIEKLKIRRSILPAVTHVDYSARIQTVAKDSNYFFYKIIEEFYKLSGCPVIINTSFNIRGEPIVCTLEDAYRCFMGTDIDYLVLGNCLLDKLEQPPKYITKREEISVILD